MKVKFCGVKVKWIRSWVLMLAVAVAVCVCYTLLGKSLAEQPPSGGSKETGTNVDSKENELEKAKNLNQQIIKRYQQGHYAEAIPLAEKVLTIWEKTLGPEHPNVATSLNNLTELYS